jgi:hypothetical protein
VTKVFTRAAIAALIKKTVDEVNLSYKSHLTAGTLNISTRPKVSYQVDIKALSMPGVQFGLEFHVVESGICYVHPLENEYVAAGYGSPKTLEDLHIELKLILRDYVVARLTPLLPKTMELVQQKLNWCFEGLCTVEILGSEFPNTLEIVNIVEPKNSIRFIVLGDSSLRYTQDTGGRCQTFGLGDIWGYEHKKSTLSSDDFASHFSHTIYMKAIRELLPGPPYGTRQSAKRIKAITKAIPIEIRPNY